jgi:hypothetical protein
MFNPAEPNPGLIYTSAAETQNANATLLAQPRPTITFAFTFQPTSSPAPQATTPPAPTATTSAATQAGGSPTTGSLCDRVRFVRDVTVPDDTEFSPGERFIKTWRLENAGTCNWSGDYTLIFVEGERMGAPVELKLTDRVIEPGEQLDVSVEMTAPQDPGTYQADFQIRNASGALFGTGENADNTFWARIRVTVPGGMRMDLIARASEADWFVETGSDEETLPFNGDPDSFLGFAGIVDQRLQEDGRTSAKILATFPPAGGGEIFGEYPPFEVQSGDLFRGRVGFLADSGGDCGPGEVTFRLLALVAGERRELGEWHKECNGRLQPVEINLSGLRGRTVIFVLEVDSEGAAAGDLAFWSSIRVER